ncbi:hypothetical protein SA3096_06180 [Aggregatibacter actinomycetemcomitans serotype e str. SA3096]|nr:hypothetical protein SA3096_06180 [Aggregatibacter actinomycetemcomitans serotype e str. SA3096]
MKIRPHFVVHQKIKSTKNLRLKAVFSKENDSKFYKNPVESCRFIFIY